MTWGQSLIMGLFSGICQLLPVSSSGHRMLLEYMMGLDSLDPLFLLMVHTACLLALLLGCRRDFIRIHREKLQNQKDSRGRRKKARSLTMRQAQTALCIMLPVAILLEKQLPALISGMDILAIAFIINGVILYIPTVIPQGNKDSRTYSAFDACCCGLGAAFFVVPGLSGIAGSLSFGQIRGGDKQHVFTLSMLLSIVALSYKLLQSFTSLGAATNVSNDAMFRYLVSAAVCFIAARAAVGFLRYLSVKIGYRGFAYYCFGAGLFCMILYMTI